MPVCPVLKTLLLGPQLETLTVNLANYYAFIRWLWVIKNSCTLLLSLLLLTLGLDSV